MGDEVLRSDVLVIGVGMAGCRAAIEARSKGAYVILATKGLFGKDAAATWMASHGFQCWGINPYDTLDLHVEDTLRCGWFLNNQENVYAFLAHVPDAARELINWGCRYKMKGDRLLPVWQLGCSVPEGRSLSPDQWPRGEVGYNFSRVLPPVVRDAGVKIIEDLFVTDLLLDQGSVAGALGIDFRTGNFKIVLAKTTIMATGGYQGLYSVTTANPNLSGDGQAMALRAGVDMADFEFNQTLPAALWPPEIAGTALPFLLLVDWDGRMYNRDGERFMAKWDPVKMERSTRALISRAIFHEIKAGKGSPRGGIYTSVTHQPESFITQKFKDSERNYIYMKLKQSGIDLLKDSIETGYVIHYCHGGSNVNAKCETDKPGLYAVGEAAAGGKDGADRMMSNALPYCMAMGILARREAAQKAKSMEIPKVDETLLEKLKEKALAPLMRKEGVKVFQVKAWLQEIMAKETGYGRTADGLKAALAEVEKYKTEVLPRLYVSNKEKRFNHEWINALEFENLLLVSECIIRNALLRKESRG